MEQTNTPTCVRICRRAVRSYPRTTPKRGKGDCSPLVQIFTFIYLSSQRQDPPTVLAHRFQRFSNFRDILLYPPQNPRMRQFNPALAYHIHQIARTQFVAEIPPAHRITTS